MTRNRKILLALALTLPELGIVALLGIRNKIAADGRDAIITLTGAVLEQNTDPSKQMPLEGVAITAAGSAAQVTGTSEASGLFKLALKRSKKNEEIRLTFERPDYKSLEVNVNAAGDELHIVRMAPQQERNQAGPTHQEALKTVTLKDVRVRYSFKEKSTIGVGSLSRQFAAPNTGNVPCNAGVLCSPDGRWKATRTAIPLDANEGNEFRNVRVSCIAGPCAFTKIDSSNFAEPARRMTLSIENWSDMTEFLVEADVTRTMVADRIRQSYPFIAGEALSFALPPTSEGPSIEADVDGQAIVFPLGPALLLSWATCSVQNPPGENKIYRCLLKPGYRFQ